MKLPHVQSLLINVHFITLFGHSKVYINIILIDIGSVMFLDFSWIMYYIQITFFGRRKRIVLFTSNVGWKLHH